MNAIVLAGGRGERLFPLTKTTPKPLVRVLGKPILEYHLRWLAEAGVTRAILACGHMSEQVVNYCRGRRTPNLAIDFCVETSPLGRGGAIKNAAAGLSVSEPVIVSQADTITDIPIREAFKAHRNAGVALTAILVPYRSRFGVVEVDKGGLVRNFREKPRLPYWANTGIFIASREFFEALPNTGDEDATILALATQGRVLGFCTNHYWRSVDLQKDIREAERDLALPFLPHEEVFNPPQS